METLKVITVKVYVPMINLQILKIDYVKLTVYHCSSIILDVLLYVLMDYMLIQVVTV